MTWIAWCTTQNPSKTLGIVVNARLFLSIGLRARQMAMDLGMIISARLFLSMGVRARQTAMDLVKKVPRTLFKQKRIPVAKTTGLLSVM